MSSQATSPPSRFRNLDDFIGQAAAFLNNDMTIYGHITIQGQQDTKRTLHGELYIILEGTEQALYLFSEWGNDFRIRDEVLGDGAILSSAYMTSDPDGRIKLGIPFGDDHIPAASPQRASRRTQQSMYGSAMQNQTSLMVGKKKVPEHLFPMPNEYIDDDVNIASLPPNMSDPTSIAKNLNARCGVALHIPATSIHLYKDAFLRPDWDHLTIINTWERILASVRATATVPLVAEELIRAAIESIKDLAAMKPLSKASPSAVYHLVTMYGRQIHTLSCQIACLNTSDKRTRLQEILHKLETEELKQARARHPSLMDLSFLTKYFREREAPKGKK